MGIGVGQIVIIVLLFILVFGDVSKILKKIKVYSLEEEVTSNNKKEIPK